ncbi:MAG TPA: hypothetical protein VMU55_08240 [Solirubrobacteraceae bacterium]|nr:hypothetical protein [Solirubrobacteraceae bacterium]
MLRIAREKMNAPSSSESIDKASSCEREAHVCLAVYSITGIVTLGHFIYGNPKIPALFYATLFTDFLTGLAVLSFVLWSANIMTPRTQRLGT